MRPSAVLLAAVVALLLVSAARGDGDDDCRYTDSAAHDSARTKVLKVAAFFSMLVCGAIGCCLPLLGRHVFVLDPDGDLFFVIKSFAAGVILATGFIHILPDAFESLSSDCLASGGPWKDFPFAGLGAMVGAIGTLIIHAVATGYFMKKNVAHAAGREMQAIAAEKASHHDGESNVRVHTHATHGSSALVVAVSGSEEDDHTIRQRIISQVLEMGILVHSVIIGISLGASHDPDTIKPLVVALSFHQMFEGMGLGGCIVQAKYKMRSMVTMVLFFCLTTPVGVIIGASISSVYSENSPMALVVEGLLNSIAAGILIYMALVDLLAEDFMNPKVQSRGKIQLGMHVSMLVGAGLMSLLAIWA